MQVRSDIAEERRIAVGMSTRTLSVDENFGVHIGTLEVEAKRLSLQCLVGVEGFAVPTDARRQIAAIATGRSFFVKVGFNTPVVG